MFLVKKSWFKVKFKFYVDNNNFCELGIRQNLTIFFVSFPVKGTCQGVFWLKLRAVFYQLQFYQRWSSFAGFFVTFDKKCRPITFRWLLLFVAFTQVVFREKVYFIKTASFNYSFTETWSIQPNPFRRWALVINGRCNTLRSNNILGKCHLDFNCLPLDC